MEKQRAIAAIGTACCLWLCPFAEVFVPLFPQPMTARLSGRVTAQATDEATNIQVYQTASPAVVSIKGTNGTGSGTLISADGLVLTNAHVVAGMVGPIPITLADGRQVQADILGFARAGVDLATLKIRNANNLPHLSLAPPGTVQVGQRAFAIGNPFGQFQGTFTTGIVSRIDRERRLIQTDAAINPGNSGGPLLNSRGQLVGVNSSLFSPARAPGNIGIGFAIATDAIHEFLTAVRTGQALRTAQRPPTNLATKDSPGKSQPPKPLILNGDPVLGRLGSSSRILTSDRSFFDLYIFEGKAGQTITLNMLSQEVDAYLILLGPNGKELAQDNDGGLAKNARIVATLPADGTYTVLANSRKAGESGTYRLQLMAKESVPPRANQPSRRDRAKTTPPILQRAGVLAIGAAKVFPPDGSLYQEHSFDGKAGQFVLITLESQDFDTYLVLLDPNGEVLAENDNAGASSNSALAVTLPITGRYRAVANARDRTGRGSYQLTVR